MKMRGLGLLVAKELTCPLPPLPPNSHVPERNPAATAPLLHAALPLHHLPPPIPTEDLTSMLCVCVHAHA